MDIDDEDGRNGDDPFFTIVEKRKLRSDTLQYEHEDGVDSKRNKIVNLNKNKKVNTDKGQNGDMMNNITTELTNTNTLPQLVGTSGDNTLEKILMTEYNNKLTPRQTKDKTDAVYKDNWIRNTDYTTFFIERIKDDTTAKNNYNGKDGKNDKDKSRESYPHPMDVAKMLYNIKANNYKELKSVGQGRFQLTYNKPRDAEQLLNSKLLKDEFKYQVYVPARFKQTIGVVRDVGKTLTEKEIMEHMDSGTIKIEKVERIMKKVSEKDFEPTYSIKVFAKGQKLPQSVEIYGVVRRCEPYIFPLTICFKCWRYGHREKFCKAKSVKCCKCGMEHEEKNCKTTTVKCINCDGAHKASDKECPERDRQDKIRIEMAMNKTSFFEAQRKFPKKQKTVEGRINSIRDFPNLLSTNEDNQELESSGAWGFTKGRTWSNVVQGEPLKDRMKIKIQPNRFPQPERYEEEPHVFKTNPYRTSEIERLTNQIKKELIEHFNLTGIVEKIQAIQNTIMKNTDKTDTIEQDLLLINISNQLGSIINPEIFHDTRTELSSNSNYGSA